MSNLANNNEKSTEPLPTSTTSRSASAKIRVRWKLGSTVENWMSYLDDALPVSSLSIPGTHDSAAFTYSWPFIATQTLNIKEQLDSGIRYFDFRLALRNDVIEMVHGSAFLGLQFDVVLATIYEWLEAHKQEGIIVQLKQDRNDENSSLEFPQAVAKTILGNITGWRVLDTTPTLGELRGKIQLFRRFLLDPKYTCGIDVTPWVDNPEQPFTIRTKQGVQVTIQDHYKLAEAVPLPALIESKGKDVAQLLEIVSHETNQWHWYINFTSTFEINFWYQITPRAVATGGYSSFHWVEGMNVRLRDHLQLRPSKRRYGIVAMDFPELATDDLIETIIASNFLLDGDSMWRSKAVFILLFASTFAMAFVGIDGVHQICSVVAARVLSRTSVFSCP